VTGREQPNVKSVSPTCDRTLFCSRIKLARRTLRRFLFFMSDDQAFLRKEVDEVLARALVMADAKDSALATALSEKLLLIADKDDVGARASAVVGLLGAFSGTLEILGGDGGAWAQSVVAISRMEMYARVVASSSAASAHSDGSNADSSSPTLRSLVTWPERHVVGADPSRCKPLLQRGTGFCWIIRQARSRRNAAFCAAVRLWSRRSPRPGASVTPGVAP